MILFIDSLDQLSDDHLARSQLAFLKNIKPHPCSVVILSTLPDEKPGEDKVRDNINTN